MWLELLVRRRKVWKEVGGRRPLRASRVCFSGYWVDSFFIGFRSHSAPHQTHRDDDSHDDDENDENDEEDIGKGQSILGLFLLGNDRVDISGCGDAGDLDRGSSCIAGDSELVSSEGCVELRVR